MLNQLLSNHKVMNRKNQVKYFEALHTLQSQLEQFRQIKELVDSQYEPAATTKIMRYDKIRRILKND